MKNIVKALKIFLKHEDKAYPFGCEHDVLHVYYNPIKFSKEELAELEELGFHPDYNLESFYKFV